MINFRAFNLGTPYVNTIIIIFLLGFKDNDTFSDMALVDFQISRVGSPVYDLSYCLYAAATKDILDKLDELLDEYFNSLKQMLLLFGENVDDIYPYTVFKDEWRRYSKASKYEVK